MLRRAQCVHHEGCDPSSPAMRNATFFLAKAPEHTWGLPSLNDATSWTNEALEAVLAEGKQSFANAINAWAEQRQFLWLAQQALSAAPAGSPEHTLAADFAGILRATIGGDGSPGSTTRIPPKVPVPSPDDDARYHAVSLGAPIDMACPGAPLHVQIDAKTASIVNLTIPGSGVGSFASSTSPLSLLQYETYDANQTEAVGSQYNYQNFGLFDKPNVTANANPQAQTIYPVVSKAWLAGSGGLCSVVARLTFPAHAVSYYGAPEITFVNYTIQQADLASGDPLHVEGAGIVSVQITMLNTTRTRLSESMHMMFHSPTGSAGQDGVWTIDKLGQPVDPHSVMLNGSQWQHGVFSGAIFGEPLDTEAAKQLLGFQGTSPEATASRLDALARKTRRDANRVGADTTPGTASASMFVLSRDAPMAFPFTAAHGPTPFPAPLTTIRDPLIGMAFNLYNTVYDTNYILFGQTENMAFELEIDVAQAARPMQ